MPSRWQPRRCCQHYERPDFLWVKAEAINAGLLRRKKNGRARRVTSWIGSSVVVRCTTP